MTKVLLILVIILLLATTVFLLTLNNERSSRIQRQDEEIAALTNYVQTLHDKLRENDEDRQESAEIPKTLQIRDLLNSYLRERNNRKTGIDTTITTEELRDDLEEFRLKQRFIPDQMPIIDRFVISQGFKETHKALDFAAPLGTEVVAAGSGVIKSVYEDKYFGNVIVIDHLNHYMTFYAHLARIFHQPSFFVEKGHAIGLVGNTGFSKYPHLHFEVIYRGDNINPEELVNQILE